MSELTESLEDMGSRQLFEVELFIARCADKELSVMDALREVRALGLEVRKKEGKLREELQTTKELMACWKRALGEMREKPLTGRAVAETKAIGVTMGVMLEEINGLKKRIAELQEELSEAL